MYSAFFLFPFSLLLTVKLCGLAKEELFLYNKEECVVTAMPLSTCVFHDLIEAAHCGSTLFFVLA